MFQTNVVSLGFGKHFADIVGSIDLLTHLIQSKKTKTVTENVHTFGMIAHGLEIEGGRK